MSTRKSELIPFNRFNHVTCSKFSFNSFISILLFIINNSNNFRINHNIHNFLFTIIPGDIFQ